MSDVNNVKSTQGQRIIKPLINKPSSDIKNIGSVFTTQLLEEYRGTFSETFKIAELSDSSQGTQFIQGLIDNKDYLSEKLGLSDDEYDSLACVALGLASQETGMGEEKGYADENNGIGGVWHSIMKWGHVNLFGGESASSGMTQLKIYDYLGNNSILTQDDKQILNELGIEATNEWTNNLYANPDKSAAATIVVLNAISREYGKYESILETKHQELVRDLEEGQTQQERIEEGNQIIAQLMDVYKSATDEERGIIRHACKQWLVSEDGSRVQDKGDREYNEETQMNILNEYLSRAQCELLTMDSINSVKFALSSPDSKMNEFEFLAFGWNKGINENSMKPDRFMSDRLISLLANPEDFGYEQFTINTYNLAMKYANLMLG